MAQIDQHTLRSVIFYEFRQGRNASQAAVNICAAFGKDTVSNRTVARWYARFQEGDTSLEDRPRSGRPSVLDDDDLHRALQAKPNASTRELASTLDCSYLTVYRRLCDSGYRKVLSTWVPHELRDSDRAARVSIATSLLLRPHRRELLANLVTGDESWVLYANHTRKSQWLPHGEPPLKQPKGELHEKKVLLCVWWDAQGVLYREFLQTGTTVTATIYADQLQKLNDAIRQKRPRRREVVLLHDNARPHVANMTRQKIVELGWEVLPHPAYSPDLAPSDFHLFRPLKQFLKDKHFDNRVQLELEVDKFFASQTPAFWRNGIHALPERWGHVIDNNGDYIVD
jgi:histone-lysine N-methyltransferase SETMAR